MSTWLVEPGRIERLGPGLAVPTRSGWLRVGKSSRDRQLDGMVANGDWVTATRATEPLPPEPEADGEDAALGEVCVASVLEAVTYAGPELLSVENSTDEACEGNHPSRLGSLTSNWLTTTGLGSRAPAAALLGPKATEALRHLEETDDCQRRYTPEGWGLVHSEGRWQALAQGDGCGVLEKKPLGIAVPERLSGAGALPAPWAQPLASHPDALDAVGSPDGRLAVVVERRRLAVYDHEGKVLASAPIQDGASVVMALWGRADREAERWAGEAHRALNPRPAKR